MKKEEWVFIPGYEGLYMVSNWGIVKSMPKNNKKNDSIMKPIIDKDGYLILSLSKNGVKKRFSVHRAVALAFIPNPNNYPLVLHDDDNPSNNHVDNLMWGTDQMNSDLKVSKNRHKFFCKEQNGNSKLKESQVYEIRNLYLTGNYSYVELSKIYNISKSMIGYIINKNNWK